VWSNRPTPGERATIVTANDAESEAVKYRLVVSFRTLSRARRYLFDVAVVVVLVATQIEIWTQFDDLRGRHAILALLATGALLLRRRAPLVAPLVALSALVASSLSDAQMAYDTDSLFFVLLLTAWLFGSRLDPRQAIAGLLAVVATGAVVLLRAPDVPWTEALWICVPIFGLGAVAHATARWAEEARLAEARAKRTEEHARRAVADERARITRELHDVIAHSVSLMTVQASAVRRLLPPEQDREREALRVVEDTGRQALAEMRRLLGILREDGEAADRAPQPGIATIRALVETMRDKGLPVELTVEGEPVHLSPGVEVSAYRIVQEALTNALEQARPEHAWVSVRYGQDEVEVEVANDGRADANGDGDGRELLGMRERVALCGGELRAGPRDGGGYRISARLPVAGAT
jgi:signal transduction histidine kinase